jgi:hypothetical protein
MSSHNYEVELRYGFTADNSIYDFTEDDFVEDNSKIGFIYGILNDFVSSTNINKIADDLNGDDIEYANLEDQDVFSTDSEDAYDQPGMIPFYIYLKAEVITRELESSVEIDYDINSGEVYIPHSHGIIAKDNTIELEEPEILTLSEYYKDIIYAYLVDKII